MKTLMRRWPRGGTSRSAGGVVGATLLLGWVSVAPAWSVAQELQQPHQVVQPGAASAGAETRGGLSELDDLLELDPQSLSNVPVLESTNTDPIVEGISKAPEKASEAPGIVDVITARDIQQFGAKNLYEVLERATSVYMTGSFLFRRNTASIRGSLMKHEDNHVLILINGRPFRDTTAGGINYSIYTAFPLETIDRIEVMRGPGSVLYGTNAFTGVINIVTKNPDQPTLHASVLAGSDGWQSYSVTGGDGDKHRGAYAGATYNRQHGWPMTATSEDPAGPDPPVTDTSPWGEDNAGVFAMYRNRGFTANLFAARPSQEVLGPDSLWPSERMVSTRLFADLGYFHEFDELQSLQTNFTYNYDHTEFPSVVGSIPFTFEAHSFLIETTYRAHLTDRLDWLVGAVADHHHGVSQVKGVFHAIPPFSETWYGVYTQFDYRPTDWLKLVGGMQANMPGEVEGGIVPRAAAIVSLTDTWTAKFLYGQAFRSPYQLERSFNIPGLLEGNPGQRPETIQTFDFQLAYHTDEFRFAATYFHSEYFDVVTRIGAAPQTYTNLGSMSFQGVELENDWQLTDRLRWLGSLTYQENVRNGVDNTTGVPNWMAKMGVAYHNKQTGFTAGLFDTFYGDATVADTAAVVNPNPDAYHLMSLNLTLDLDRWWGLRSGYSPTVQFMVQNLLDEDIHHVEFEREAINSLPGGPGRTYYGGFSVRY